MMSDLCHHFGHCWETQAPFTSAYLSISPEWCIYCGAIKSSGEAMIWRPEVVVWRPAEDGKP